MGTKKTQDFNKARVGSVVMAACATCGQPTGEIIIKSKSGSSAPEYNGPSLVRFEDASCEFCEFLGKWLAHTGTDPKKTGLKYGVAKIVEGEDEKLLAYVPFSEEDLAKPNKPVIDGVEVTLKHGMVVLARREDGDLFKLVRVLKPGV